MTCIRIGICLVLKLIIHQSLFEHFRTYITLKMQWLNVIFLVDLDPERALFLETAAALLV